MRRLHGKTLGAVGEWAERHGISRSAASHRIKKAGIPKFKNGEIDFDLADKLWASVATGVITPTHSRYAEYKEMKEKGLEFKPFSEILARDAAENAKTGVQTAKTSAKGSKSPKSGSKPADLLSDFDTGRASSAVPGAASASNGPIMSDPDDLFAEGIENLTASEIMARLRAETEMSPKATAEYATLIIKLEENLHKLRSTTRSLVPLAEVRDFESRVLTDLRSALIPIGSELRDELAGCNDPNRCQDLVDSRIYGALRQVSRYNPESPQIGERQNDDLNGQVRVNGHGKS